LLPVFPPPSTNVLGGDGEKKKGVMSEGDGIVVRMCCFKAHATTFTPTQQEDIRNHKIKGCVEAAWLAGAGVVVVALRLEAARGGRQRGIGMEGLRSCRLGHRQGKTGRMAVTCCWCCWWWWWMAAAAAAGAGGVGWHGAAQHDWRPRRGQHHPKPSVDAGQDPRAAAALVVSVYQGLCLMAWLRWVVQAAAGAGSGAAAGHGSGDPPSSSSSLDGAGVSCFENSSYQTTRASEGREGDLGG